MDAKFTVTVDVSQDGDVDVFNASMYTGVDSMVIRKAIKDGQLQAHRAPDPDNPGGRAKLRIYITDLDEYMAVRSTGGDGTSRLGAKVQCLKRARKLCANSGEDAGTVAVAVDLLDKLLAAAIVEAREKVVA
jgi:hypothetical protein